LAAAVPPPLPRLTYPSEHTTRVYARLKRSPSAYHEREHPNLAGRKSCGPVCEPYAGSRVATWSDDFGTHRGLTLPRAKNKNLRFPGVLEADDGTRTSTFSMATRSARAAGVSRGRRLLGCATKPRHPRQRRATT
jgi:hypothetical protein